MMISKYPKTQQKQQREKETVFFKLPSPYRSLRKENDIKKKKQLHHTHIWLNIWGISLHWLALFVYQEFGEVPLDEAADNNFTFRDLIVQTCT